MSERNTYFADVVLPIPVNREFTYRVPFELNEYIQAGVRVVVPFGKAKYYTAIVTRIHESIPKDYQAKYIEHLLDETPIVTQQQYQLWRWMSDYYMAPIGDVMNAALPANFKLASETKIVLHPDFEGGTVHNIEEREQLIIDALELQENLTLNDISSILGIKTVQPILKKMMDKRLILSAEELQEKYRSKYATYIELEAAYQTEDSLSQLFSLLESQQRKANQLENLLLLLKTSGKFERYEDISVLKSELEKNGASLSALQSLERNGYIKSVRKEISRLKGTKNELTETKVLSEAQEKALLEIKNAFAEKDVCLLHGVTGSGKTELYVELIEEQLQKGKQVLFLLPEIALTTQIIDRLSRYFGDKIGVYHSKFNQNERIEIWNGLLGVEASNFQIILGARSSIFLPFRNLGLVIVDEEHENSFKQYDPSPRYQARDSAIVLAHLHQAKVLLGSATPSIESYFNAKEGKFALVELMHRHGNIPLPEILCADMSKERKQKTAQSHFSSFLMKNIEETLANGEQVILFQNRRGYTPLWRCELCEWVPRCKNCDVSLTYHKHINMLKCHYCSYVCPPVGTCGDCGSTRLSMLGFGTEKIEDELSLMLPKAIIRRLDLDSTRNKNAHQEILESFGEGKVNILIGTQMLSKGLDFDRVSLVGILDADMLIRFPDFRAFERSYQLMTQVAGRAGRKNKRGKVIIQTSNPDQWVIQQVISGNYTNLYQQEIIERRNFHYPPFFKLIRIQLKHKDDKHLEGSALELGSLLKNSFGNRVLGPEFPLVRRIQNYYIKEITLKLEREASLKKIKVRLHEIIAHFYSSPSNKSLKMSIDVDPC